MIGGAAGAFARRLLGEPRASIRVGPPGRGIRLDRWRLCRIGPVTVSIHRIEAAADSPAWDDHRWRHLGIALAGSLREDWFEPAGRDGPRGPVRTARLRAGSVRLRRAETVHRLSGGRLWTLVFSGPARRLSHAWPRGLDGPRVTIAGRRTRL